MHISSKTVLLVDDGRDERMLFERAAAKVGASFALRCTVDGEDALAYLDGKGRYADRGAHPSPDLVVLDLNMNGMNGFEVLSWIRKHPHLHSLPVVMLTASNLEKDVAKAYALGVNSYLVKPMSITDLMDMVRALDGYWMRWTSLPRVGVF